MGNQSPTTSIIFATGGCLVAGVLAYLSFSEYVRHTNTSRAKKQAEREALFNPDVLKTYSGTGPINTPLATYDEIRSFYRPHQHLEKLPSLAKLPLLVFIHGLGGSLAQFAPLLRSLGNIAPCFGIDLPGCGLSSAPKDSGSYTTEALTMLLKSCIKSICHEKGHESVILVGHSMGCSLAASLVAEGELSVAGFIAICPRASPPTLDESRSYRRMLSLPNVCLNVLRYIDRWGGPKSHSVRRFVGREANMDLKKLQLQYNAAFPTDVWMATPLGLLPSPKLGAPQRGFPGRETWSRIQVPLFLIAGEADKVTPANEIATIASFLQSESVVSGEADTVMADSESVHENVVRTAVLPKPASHALMYDHATYRTLAGLVEDFLAKHISVQLSLGWQMQHLTTTGKWDVKNLKKWEGVLPVSCLIGKIFRALKTLREQDEEHTPSVFVPRWTGKIFAVIDISHETPIYNTRALDKGGIQYHKFATVSKMPPSVEEVQGFIALVDRLREEIERRFPDDNAEHSLGVHCHYGTYVHCHGVPWTTANALSQHAGKADKDPRLQSDRVLHHLLPRGTRKLEIAGRYR